MKNKNIYISAGLIFIVAIVYYLIYVGFFANTSQQKNNSLQRESVNLDYCARAGESTGSCVNCLQKCCRGLKSLTGYKMDNGECTELMPPGAEVKCSDCGNNICDNEYGENDCNCPEDCKDVKNLEKAQNVYFKQYGDLDENEKIISKYYELISESKFKDAYNMKKNPKVSLDEFIKMYSDAKGIEVQFPYQNSEDKYDVYVYYLGDAPNKPLEYKVVMKVSGTSIETITSNETSVRSGDAQVYVSREGNIMSVILENGTDIIVVDNMEINEEFNSNRFSDLQLSNDGTKLFYTIHGWEYIGNVIYDLKDKKQLVKFDWAEIKTTPNEEFIYTCTSAGIGTGPGGVVYDMRGDKFEQIYELSQDFPQAGEFNNKTKGEDIDCEDKCIMNVDCEYLKGENTILFTLDNGGWKDDRGVIATVKYDLDSGKSEVKKY